MIVSFEIDADILRGIIDSLFKPLEGSNERSIDVNMRVDTSQEVVLHTYEADRIQITNTLSESDEISVNVEEDHNFVFTSDVLRDILSKASGQQVKIKFFEHEYSVRLESQEGFSTPTSLDLNLVSQSEYQEIKTYSGFQKVANVGKMSLLDNLEAMNVVSRVVQLKIPNNELWIAVSDMVEGEGEVMTDIEPECEITNFSAKYQLEPIISFLDNVHPAHVDLYLKSDGALRLQAESPGLSSAFYIAPRIE